MKLFQILFLLITFQSVSFSSMLLSEAGFCIEEYYVESGSFYYLRSDNLSWYSSISKSAVSSIYQDYNFDGSTLRCTPSISYILGMKETDFNFLLGLMGVIFGGLFMFFTTQIFMIAGGKK